jgi:hypothetical protein
MDEPVRARAPHHHLRPRLALLDGPAGRRLARHAPRLAAGLVIAAALAWGFVPTVIRIYGPGGSLAGAVEPWMIAAGSVLANALVAALAVAALVPRRGHDRDAGAP